MAIRKMLLLLVLGVSLFQSVSASVNIKSANVVHKTAKELYNGVNATYIAIEDNFFGKQKINIVEFNPSQEDLYLRVGFGGTSITELRRLSDTVQVYSNIRESVLAAINGDLWMTSAHTVPAGATKVLSVPRGLTMTGGVILCSPQIQQEDGEEWWAVGITSEHKMIIGTPKVNLVVNNVTKNITVNADGLNRLPADNSLIIYTSMCSDRTYAPESALEIVIDNVKGEFKHGSVISGVVSGIAAGGETALAPDRIILMARGNRTSLLEKYKVGDNVKINVSLTETTCNNASEWQKVTEAVGGHMPMIVNGKQQIGQSISMPSTVVAIRKDGSAFFMVNDGRQPEWSSGLQLYKMPMLLEEMGAYNAIHLDGGGSSTLVYKVDGRFSVVNRPSDGSVRKINNCLMLIKGEKRKSNSTSAALTTSTASRSGEMKTTPNSSTVTETKGGTLTTKCIASSTNQKTEISTSFASERLVDESNPTGSNTGNNPTPVDSANHSGNTAKLIIALVIVVALSGAVIFAIFKFRFINDPD